MRVLLDQGTPAPLARHLTHHDVATAYELGWSTLRNGELLDRAEQFGFGVMVTTDTNLKYQQNLVGRPIALVVLLSTSWPRIQRVVDTVVGVIDRAAAGDYLEVDIPP